MIDSRLLTFIDLHNRIYFLDYRLVIVRIKVGLIFTVAQLILSKFTNLRHLQFMMTGKGRGRGFIPNGGRSLSVTRGTPSSTSGVSWEPVSGEVLSGRTSAPSGA